MKVLVVLGVAVLCMSQVHAGDPGDLLHSLFQEKTKTISAAKVPVTTEFAVAPVYNCDAKKVVDLGSTLIKNTVDIASETFGVIYNTINLNKDTCPYNAFRCFLLDFTETKDMMKDVTDKVLTYKDTAVGLSSGISDYFHNCMHK